jgi:hypothetical protein
MILKDFIEQIRHTKISGIANGERFTTILLCSGTNNTTNNNRFIIEFFDGAKIEKHKFKNLDDISSHLLQAKLVKWDIVLQIEMISDYTTIEFVVSV